MAGLEPLAHTIFHEKQQPGSMLCAQHALNNLLQGSYFSAPDLAAIAHDLDELEASYDESNTGKSTNMDDTGFFSVQVLENALAVWGLRLVRWRSEEMREAQDEPHTQLAFILNLELHWFALRRFGPLIPADNGHWFNLNSFLPQPEWVSRTYLGLVLQQAEQEGYSVFVVTRVDPSSDAALARTDADEVAATLPQPTSASTRRLDTSRIAQQAGAAGGSGSGGTRPQAVEGAEDEDLMLQAALQASLMGEAGHEIPQWLRDHAATSFIPQAPVRPPQQSLAAGNFGNTFDRELEDPEDADDPIAASIARNRALMERMRAEQEMAFRGALDDDIMQHVQRVQHAAGIQPAPPPPLEEALSPRRRRTAGDDDEEAELRRAIAASRAAEEALAAADRPNRYAGLRGDGDEDEDDDAMDEDEQQMFAQAEAQRLTRQEQQPQGAPVPALRQAEQHVVYDDDDAELQAALRASLEGLPSDFMEPPSPVPARTVPTTSHTSAPPPVRVAPEHAPVADEPASPPAQELSPEELRKKRLARFGQ
ncbi:Josephin-domain-containing protein [Auriculariales sp. MPI-PUGE-AT-0066]|nr:Josephin-domain-containing protein [Auriculariales sp. MPI-PUGE-AT-0066]